MPAKTCRPTRWTIKKNVSSSLNDRLHGLLDSICPLAAPAESCARRLATHMLACLLCPERGTLTNLICTSGAQQADWSAHYRLYSKDRVNEDVLFDSVRTTLQQALPAGHSLVISLDDTLIRKRGTHIEGVGWKRDPLGPSFQTNLVRGQRYLQFSAAWPLENGSARLVPIAFVHAPTAAKLPKEADVAQTQAYREEKKQKNLNAYALSQMELLNKAVAGSRRVIFCGDGSYTNRAILRGMPAESVYIGRLRKDAVLHHPPLPKTAGANGRPRSYGELASTPEQLRQDEPVPWQRVVAYAAGKKHSFKIKTLGPVQWRKAGTDLRVRIVVIAPLGYRLREGGRVLYRQPAYLLCTDPELAIEQLLQYYLWRWGIEVNFREEKTLIGVGQAQVRSAASNQHQPAVCVAAYSLLWAAALGARQQGQQFACLRPPRWRAQQQDDEDGPKLPSTGELLRLLRYESWAGAIRPGTLSHFVNNSVPDPKWPKPSPSLPATLFCAA